MTGSELGEESFKENQQNLPELSVEKACEEYNNSVKLTLAFINQQLDDALLKNFDGLEELAIKIAARTTFLVKNPSFLSCIVYNKDNVQFQPLLEFDEIKVTLKEHLKRIEEKIEEIQTQHTKLLQIVADNGRDTKFIKKYNKLKQESDDEFQDCLENLTKNDSFDKVTIQKNAYTDFIIPEIREPPMLPLFPDIIPEVQRGKPHEDIHEKLVQQLIQTDSLEGFLKLMGRKPARKSKTKIIKGKELERKYTGSLWFFPEKKKITKTASVKCSKITKKCSKLLATNSQPSRLTNPDKTIRIRPSLESKRFKCYDLLDDIDRNDVKPIKSEYPRRDNITPPPEKSHTYLEKMMDQNDRVWKKLLQPNSPKPLLKKPKLSSVKVKQVKNLMEYLTAPQHFNKQSLIVMPVRVMYDNFPTKENETTVLLNDPPITKDDKNEKNQKKDMKNVSFETDKKVKMLEQLRGLKMKNDNIQKNIQKAIDVIETKMIDLLSSPNNTGTQEAFNAMEKEITNVLKMMNENEKNKQLEKKKKINDVKKMVTKIEPLDIKKVEAEKDENVKISLLKTAKLPSFITPRRPIITNFKLESGDTTIPREQGKENLKKIEIKKANIEEGEKILGQVDNVIKKIDNIYNKINEEIKPKKTKKDSPKIKPELKLATLLDLKYLEGPKAYTVPPTIYHHASFYIPIKFQKPAKIIIDINRHTATLQTFYIFFFTTLFLALNFDYVS